MMTGKVPNYTAHALQFLFLSCSHIFNHLLLNYPPVAAILVVLTQRCRIIHRAGLDCRLRYLIVVCFHLP